MLILGQLCRYFMICWHFFIIFWYFIKCWYFFIHDNISTSSLYTVTWSQYAFILMLPHLMERWRSITSDSLFWYARFIIWWCLSLYDDTLAPHDDILTLYIMLFDIVSWYCVRILLFTRIVQLVSVGFWFYEQNDKKLHFYL